MNKVSLSYKVLGLALLLVAVTLALGYYAYLSYLEIIIRHELTDLADETALGGSRLSVEVLRTKRAGATLSYNNELRTVLLSALSGQAWDKDRLQELPAGLKARLDEVSQAGNDIVQIGVYRQDGQPLFFSERGINHGNVSAPDWQSWRKWLKLESEAERQLRRNAQNEAVRSELHLADPQQPEQGPLSGEDRKAAGLLVSANDAKPIPVYGSAKQPDERVLGLRFVIPVRREGSSAEGADKAPIGYVSMLMDLRPQAWRLQNTSRMLSFLTDDQGNFIVHPLVPLGEDPAAFLKERAGGQVKNNLSELFDDTNLKTLLPDRETGFRLGRKPEDSEGRVPPDFGETFDHTSLIAIANWEGGNVATEANKLEQKLLDWKDGNPELRFGSPSILKQGDSLRVVVSLPTPGARPGAEGAKFDPAEKLEKARDLLEQHTGRKPDEVQVSDFAVQFVKLQYDPSAAHKDHYFGYVRAASYDEMEADVTNEMWQRLAVPTIGVGLLVLAGAFFGTWLITRPLRQLTAAAASVAGGQYEVKLPLAAPGEIGGLAHTFKSMVGQIRQREMQVKQEEAKVGSIVELAADGILTINEDGTVESFNRAAEKLFLYTRREVVGRHFRTLLAQQEESATSPSGGSSKKPGLGSTWGELIDTVNRGLLGPAYAEEGTVTHGRELEARRKDGSTFPAEVSVSVIQIDLPLTDSALQGFNSAYRRLYTVIARDITDRKLQEVRQRRYEEELERRVNEKTHALQETNEQLRRAQKTRDLFLASVSHELRTPMTTVIGYADLLRDSQLSDEQQRDVQVIYSAGQDLQQLISDILDIQKIMSDKFRVEPEEFELAELIQDVGRSMLPEVEKNRNRLIVDCPRTNWQVTTAKLRLRQVLRNLIHNAAKFTQDGTITLRVREEERQGIAGMCIEVSDTGLGMAPDQLEKLRRFEPFTKLLTKAQNPGGTGLGLPICRGICEALGGSIAVDSKVNEGSTFRVWLPQNSEGARQFSLSTPKWEAVMPGQPGSINHNLVLVIDDDPQVCELLKRYLEEDGMQVQTVLNGQEGLRLARTLRPAAITLDAVMPDLDGWAVLAALTTDPATADIPVLMVTMLDDRSRGFALGASAFVTKPLDKTQLTGALQKCLATKAKGLVLVVDDEPEVRRLAGRMLAEQGWRVIEAADGEQALQQVEEHLPDAVVLDLLMPVKDGFEVVEALRSHPGWSSMPIIIITAKDLSDVDRRRLSGRVAQIIDKASLDWDKLRKDIRAILNRTPATRSFNGASGGASSLDATPHRGAPEVEPERTLL